MLGVPIRQVRNWSVHSSGLGSGLGRIAVVRNEAIGPETAGPLIGVIGEELLSLNTSDAGLIENEIDSLSVFPSLFNAPIGRLECSFERLPARPLWNPASCTNNSMLANFWLLANSVARSLPVLSKVFEIVNLSGWLPGIAGGQREVEISDSKSL